MSDYSSKSMAPTCNICHNDFDLYYRMPRIVPKCGHTYCQKCITNKLTIRSNRKVFVCPECSSQVIIRKGVIEDVPKNIGIIDVLKNMKKFGNNDKKEQKKKQLTNYCSEHQKPLELICETCNFTSICSHCALFGQHKNHSFSKEAPASQIDLKQVKQFYQLLCDTFKITLSPTSQNNIKSRMKRLISQNLHKSITEHFKQYYQMVQKRQYELLQQCNNIVINEGGIDNNIQKLIKQYDNLKDKYQLQWKGYAQNQKINNIHKIHIGISSIQDYINKCQVFLDNIKNIEKYATQHVEKLNKDIGLRIMQSTLFKIQEMPFSLKSAVEQLNKEPVDSPERRARLKSATSEVKSKSVINRQQSTKPMQLQDKRMKKSQVKSTIVKSPRRGNELANSIQDFTLLDIEKLQLINYKEQSKNSKQLKELVINNKSVDNRNTLPPKLPKNNHTLNDFDSKTVNLKNNKQDQKYKYYNKEISPAKTINVVNKKSNNNNSILTNNNNNFSSVVSVLNIQDLKFVRPTKEISFQFLSKYQQIMVQTDRQAHNGTLQLVSLQITDNLLLYTLDYIRIKKYQFQVIKLVKNLITDQGFKILLSFLINDNSTQLVNLTSNNLTSKSLEIILLFATKNTILKTFNISNNKISSTQAKVKRSLFQKFQLEITI